MAWSWKDTVGAGAATLAGGPIGAKAYFDYKSASSQAQAAQDAIKLQEKFNRENKKDAYKRAGRSYDASQGFLEQNRAGAENLATSLRGNVEALGGQFGESRGILAGAVGQGRSDLQSGIGQAQGILADLAARDPYANFETSPGFEFRRRMGEQAISQRNAATGGRLGGNALRELASFNQDLASQEYDKFIQQRMGMNAQDQNLAAMRAQQAMGGAQALSGQSMAGGGALSGLIANNAMNLSSQGGLFEQNIYGAQSGINNSLSNLLAQRGNLAASIATGGQMPNYMAAVPGAGAGYAAIGSGIGQGINAAMFVAGAGGLSGLTGGGSAPGGGIVGTGNYAVNGLPPVGRTGY